MSLPLKDRWALLAIGIVLTVGPWQTVSAQSRTASTKPNVVLILVDNVGWGDFSSYGGSVPTPRIDSIATDGLRFNNYTVEAASQYFDAEVYCRRCSALRRMIRRAAR